MGGGGGGGGPPRRHVHDSIRPIRLSVALGLKTEKKLYTSARVFHHRHETKSEMTFRVRINSVLLSAKALCSKTTHVGNTPEDVEYDDALDWGQVHLLAVNLDDNVLVQIFARSPIHHLS